MSNNHQRAPKQSMFDSRLSRRSLMAGAGATVLSVAALGGTPRVSYAALQGQSLSGKFKMEAHDYTPSQSMTKSTNNPIPHDALARAVKSYQGLHPDVEIELERVPAGTDSRVWAVTQLTGERAPEVIWTQSFDANRDAGKGWWVELDPYMAQPNPYVKAGETGSAKWLDQFFASPTAAKVAPNGHLYVVPYDLVTTFFFYNKTIFQKAGVEVPATYADLIKVLAKLKDSGVVPYNGMQWSRPQLGDMLLRHWESKIPATGGAGAYTQKDITLAIIAGTFDATKPEYKEWLRLMKDSVPYWSQQWTVAATTKFDLQFSQGKLAILEDGSWRFGLLKANDALGFEWGSFFMPPLTKGTGPGLSELADGKPAPSIGGATANQFGVTNTAVKNGNVDLVIDFLRYICAPAQASEIIGEVGQFLPNIKGVEVNQDLAPALKAVSSGIGEAGMIAYADKIDAEAATNIGKVTDTYLLGRTQLDETATKLQQLYMDQAQKTAKDQGWK